MTASEKNERSVDVASLEAEIYALTRELLGAAKMRPGQLLVVGCSTSEVRGERIGHASSPEIAQALYRGIGRACREAEVDLAAQCCEHLNRALVVERAVQERHGYQIVNALPQPHAGGSWATEAYAQMADPCLVSEVRGQAALDIGDTFVGMHLQPVVVPVRLQSDHILEAHLTAARVRAPYWGGPRASFNEELL